MSTAFKMDFNWCSILLGFKENGFRFTHPCKNGNVLNYSSKWATSETIVGVPLRVPLTNSIPLFSATLIEIRTMIYICVYLLSSQKSVIVVVLAFKQKLFMRHHLTSQGSNPFMWKTQSVLCLLKIGIKTKLYWHYVWICKKC